MAKKNAKSAGHKAINKSEAIRKYMTEHPDAGPTAVAQALNAREGWRISPAYVSTIKNKVRETKGRGRRGRGGGRRAGGRGAVSEQALLKAKELARLMGGINQAKAALDLLARLTS